MKLVKPDDIKEMITKRENILTQLRIDKIINEAVGIKRFVFVMPQGDSLDRFEAGAHIDVHITDDVMRQYSLCSDPIDEGKYEIAVLCDQKGRGGSKQLHELFRVGEDIMVSVPRNHFPLAEKAERHLLLAGGIGVTPMIAMIHQLERRGDLYEMHYCTRSIETTAFKEFLAPRLKSGFVKLHHDNGDLTAGLNIAALLEKQRSGEHLYFCGPGGFMSATKTASAHWDKGTVHSEYFTAPSDVDEKHANNTLFHVRIKDTDDVFEVPADKSIVVVLRENGFPVDTQCEDGYCGTCLSRYVDGEPEHRDVVLDEEDRSEFMLICCSRSKTKEITLDI